MFLLSNYLVINAMENSKPWYSSIFSSKKKELTPEEKIITMNQEFAKFLNKGWGEGDLSHIKELIAMGANVNAVDEIGATLLIQLSVGTRIELARLLLQAGADPNMHYQVISKPNPTRARMILERTLKRRYTALINAVISESSAMVELLIDHGADRTMKNHYGQTALDIAKAKGFTEIADLLSKTQKLR